MGLSDWRTHFGLDVRFVRLAALTMVATWVTLLVLTLGLILVVWRVVLVCQFVALPFSLLGWSLGFAMSRRLGAGLRWSAMIAGWSALALAEAGLAFTLNLSAGSGGALPGMIVWPILVPIVTLGVLWLYRAETWGPQAAMEERMTA